MAVAGSLQLSQIWGVNCRNLEGSGSRSRSSKQVKGLGLGLGLLGKDRLPFLLSTRLSSPPGLLRQRDSLSIRLSDSLYRPTLPLSHKRNDFRCHASVVPGGQPLKFPGVKAAASTLLMRSYDLLQGNSIILKLAPALGVIIFSIWGLRPLVRHCRNILLHKNDNNWKKSGTNYVTTSYIQPLLLWASAMLICRVMDPVRLPTEASQIVKQRLLNFIRSLSTVLAFAYCSSSVIQQAQKYFMESNEPGDARNMGFQFAGKAVYSAVWIAAFSLFMELLGFSTQKWLTAGGLGTVLLTLAGREIFTNFLSSAMIHATRPFVANEWIQTKIEGYEVSGTVEHVGWWSPTIIRGEDREAVHIPNHKFTVNVVRNLSQKTHWRIKTHLAISHLDAHKINNIVADMRKVLAKNPQVEQQRLHRRVFLDNVNSESQALLILVSCFVKTSHFEEYLCVKEAILLDLLRVISHHRARLATPIRTMQKIYTDPELENVPFGDTIYDREGVASRRPLLLIEPSYKINGEDKTKSQTRSGRVNGEQESKTTMRYTPDTKAGISPKSDSKAKEAQKSEAKADTKADQTKDPRKVAAVAASEPGVHRMTVNPSPNSAPPATSNIAEAASSDAKATVSNASTSSEKNSDSKQSKNVGPGIVKQSSKVDTSSISSPEAANNEAGGLQESSPLKQETERKSVCQPSTSRPALEENIVLGVALGGSKRTLPIDEDIAPHQTPAGTKGMATATRNGTGLSTTEKDRKEGQISTRPNPPSSDQ